MSDRHDIVLDRLCRQIVAGMDVQRTEIIADHEDHESPKGFDHRSGGAASCVVSRVLTGLVVAVHCRCRLPQLPRRFSLSSGRSVLGVGPVADVYLYGPGIHLDAPESLCGALSDYERGIISAVRTEILDECDSADRSQVAERLSKGLFCEPHDMALVVDSDGAWLEFQIEVTD
jgi:hypothetical protein